MYQYDCVCVCACNCICLVMFTADKFVLPPLKFQQGIVVAYRCFLLLALSISTTAAIVPKAATAAIALALQYTAHMGIVMICFLLLKMFNIYFIFSFYSFLMLLLLQFVCVLFGK